MTIDDLSAAANRVASSLGAQSLMSHKQGATAAATTANDNTGTTTGVEQQITSADFLTLLVTEMKNQDPTQPTDPNEYIQQLVGVNSLQQLISINQDLSGLNKSAPSGGSVSGPSSVS